MARKRVVEQLVTELTADSARMQTELDRTLRSTQAWGQKVGAVAVRAGQTLAATGTAAAVGMVALVNRSADSARELDNLRRVANASGVELQRLAIAGEPFGLQQDKIADILKDVNDKVGDFLTTGAGPLKDFFESVAPQVGVTAEQFRELSGPQALQLYVSSLEKANLSQAEMTFFMEAIASDATLLLPLLRDNGAELERLSGRAEDLNLILSDVEIDQLKDVADQFDELGLVMDATGKRIALGAAPAVADLVDLLQDPDTIRAAQDLGSAIVTAFTTASKAIVSTVDFVQWAGEEFARITAGVHGDDIVGIEDEIKQIEKLLNGSLLDKTGRLRFFGPGGLVEYYDEGELKAELAKLEAAREQFYKNATATKPPPLFDLSAPEGSDSGGDTNSDPATVSTEALKARESLFAAMQSELATLKEQEAAYRKLQTSADDYLVSTERRLAMLGKEGEAAKVLYEIERGRFKDLAPDRQQQLLDAARSLDLAEQQAASAAAFADLQQSLLTEEQAIEESYKRRLQIVLDNTLEGSAQRNALEVQLAEERNAALAEIETRKSQVILQNSAQLFDGLADLTRAFSDKQSSTYKALFAIEKGFAIAEAGLNIKNAMSDALAQGSTWQEKLAAMGAVASATAGLISSMEQIEVAGAAHGGMENVPKESTYLLDKGERVLSPQQNQDLTSFLQGAGNGAGGFPVQVTVTNDGSLPPIEGQAERVGNELRVIVSAVKRDLSNDLGSGRGFARDLESRYALSVKSRI